MIIMIMLQGFTLYQVIITTHLIIVEGQVGDVIGFRGEKKFLFNDTSKLKYK